MTPQDSGARRDRLATGLISTVVTLSDLLPPRLRYGYVHPATAGILRMPLPSVTARGGGGAPGTADGADGADEAGTNGVGAAEPLTADPTRIRAGLLLDDLDVGGIGSVIETLARGLEGEGIVPVVVGPGSGSGARAQRLRATGIEVRRVDDAASAAAALADLDVLELHSAPRFVEQAAIASGLPLVTAMHNTEIHFTRARWRQFRELMAHSRAGIAVSETVRAFHARRLTEPLGERIRVVENGAASADGATPEARRSARAALGEAIGVDLADDLVVVCLARYDSQKNVAGTVAGVLDAFDAGISAMRFVYAGTPSDWAELRRADALRRERGSGERIHLLGNSDPALLLAAADAFVLNSFFEGWPVAATEAAAAGLPLVLSDVGGARELVAADPDRSTLIPNAVGEAAAVSDRSVRAARRATRHQRNHADLAEALRRVQTIAGGDAPRHAPPAIAASVHRMVSGHARILRIAADAGVSADA